MNRRTCAAVLLVLLATAAPSQERLTIDVSIVNVDVAVTDREGRSVTGLTAKDFEIRENNKPQPITNFTEYRNDKGSGLQFPVCSPKTLPGSKTSPLQTENCRPDPTGHAPEKPEKRTIVLFIERFLLPAFRTRPLFVQAANAYGVTIYPLYPSGIASSYTGLDAADSPSNINTVDRTRDHQAAARDQNVLTNETASLQEIAKGTGGVLAWGHKDIASLLPRITADLDSYYSLAYRATSATGARKITVKVKNPRYTVRTRSRVVERTDTEKMQDRVITNLHHPLTSAVIPIEATVGDRTDAGIPITIHIPVTALTTRPGGAGQLTVFIATGADLGIINDVQHRTAPFTLHPSMPTHFTYDFTLAVDTLTDRVSIGVLDEVSKEYGLVRIELK